MTLKTLENALDVLSNFTRENPSWGLRALAKEIGMNHSILYRILETYERKGFLVKQNGTKQYELGPKMIDLLAVVQHKMALSDLVVPVMKAISERTDESVFLTWKDGFHGRTVEMLESPRHIKFAVSVGTKTPLYVGASVKVIMAFLSHDEQLNIIRSGLEEFTDNTLLDEKAILSNLNDIKAQGWCYSEGEFADDVFGFGVPLFGLDGNVLGSLAIAGPVYRMTSENMDPFLEALLNGQADIEQAIRSLGIETYN